MRPNHWPFIAILLLIAAKMVIDPDGLAEGFDKFGFGVRNFERELQLRRPWRQFPRRYAFDRPRIEKTSVRIAGCLLIGVAMIIAALQ